MTEQWTRWEPISGLAPKYDIDSISNSVDGLKIVLSDADDDKNKVQVIFKDSVLSYRNTGELLRINMRGDFGDQSGVIWTFYKVSNSIYIQWVKKQLPEVNDLLLPTHFCLLTSEYFLDVIATYEPKVEFIQL